MNSRSLSNLAIAGFILLGVVFIALRYHSRREADIARQDSRWVLTYEVQFDATTTPTGEATTPSVLRIAMPFDTPYCQVISEQWINAGLKARRVVYSPSGTKELQLSTTQPGKYSPQADFELRLSPRADSSRDPGLESLSRDDRALYLNEGNGVFPIRDVAKTAEFQKLSQSGATEWEQIEDVFDECMSIRIEPDAVSGVTSALANDRTDSPAMRARTMVTILRAMGIPSRLVTGFVIGQTSNAVPRVWVEVFYHQRWVPFDTENGYSQTLPGNYVPVRRGGDTVVEAVEGTIQPGGEHYTIARLPSDPSVAKAETPHPLQILNLERLPVPMHTVLKILLLLPLAALITAVMRNVIGLGTFGTFSPALLAMSFIYANWRIGLLILLIVVTIGLFGRSILERLRLLMVPRLSIILTMVILCVVFTLSALFYIFPSVEAQAVLLPMVIMTMLIERFHVTVEEDGYVYAAQLSLGTLVVAMLCFAVLRWPEMGNFVLIYPETHFFTIAVFILLGRYAGYRLTELWRFRDLVETGEPVR